MAQAPTLPPDKALVGSPCSPHGGNMVVNLNLIHQRGGHKDHERIYSYSCLRLDHLQS